MTTFLPLILLAYFLGSVPFGLIIGKAHGLDLRKLGSGNIGATNAGRTLGKKWGILCFFLDVCKGLVPMILVPAFGLVDPESGPLLLALWLLVGCAAVLGHVFPIYLGFKGGKGVATSLGIVLGLWPYYTLCGAGAFLVWVIVLFVTRYVSAASISAALAFPVLLILAVMIIDRPGWDFETLWPLSAMAVLMGLLVVLRHTDNIRRLREGSESKVFNK